MKREYKNELGQLHRTDGPAIEWDNGEKRWYIDGLRHREDDPAVERSDGGKEWYINDKCHREDGPAVEYRNGSKDWYLNGNYYSEQEWQDKVIKIKLERLKKYGN
jgi:hypothetical protein